MSLLSLIQGVADRVGAPLTATIIGSTDSNTRGLLALAQGEGKQLASRDNFAWQVLQKEYTFQTVISQEAYSLPSDFAKLMNETVYDRSRNRYVVGPIDYKTWNSQKAMLVTRVDPGFRLRGNQILIMPVPTAVSTIAFEYVSKNWCKSASDTEQNAWAADTDTGILDEDLMALGIVWRWLKSQGFDYA